jgi:hypothetical protein
MDLFVPEGKVQQQRSHHEPGIVPIIEDETQNIHIGSPCSDADDPHTRAHEVFYHNGWSIKCGLRNAFSWLAGLWRNRSQGKRQHRITLQVLVDLFVPKGEIQQQSHDEPDEVSIIDEETQNVDIGLPCSDADDLHKKKKKAQEETYHNGCSNMFSWLVGLWRNRSQCRRGPCISLQVLTDLFVPEGEVQQQRSHHKPRITMCVADDLHTRVY